MSISLLWATRTHAQTATSLEDRRPSKAVADDATSSLERVNDEPQGCLKNPLLGGCHTVRIDAVVYENLFFTQRYVADRELLFSEGDHTSLRQIEESITRLRNLGIFRTVSYALVTQEVAGVDKATPLLYPGRVLKIMVDERWTMMPGFSFVQGGDLMSLNASIYDINFAGRYIELGFLYGRLGRSETFFKSDGAANTYAGWVRDPRFLNSRWSVSADVWSYSRLRTFYDDGGEVEGGYQLRRFLVAVRSQGELNNWLRVGLNAEFMNDEFSLNLLAHKTQLAQRTNAGGAPSGGLAVIARAHAYMGRVNRDDFYYDGWSITQSIAHSDPLWGATYHFTTFDTTMSFYKRIPWRGNIATRLRFGLTDTKAIQHKFFIGGLDRVRGYVDSRFRGTRYWTANAEYRVAPLATRWFVLQPIVFADAGRATDSFGALFGGVDAASTGFGIRIISPKVYGLVARFDYAFALLNGGLGGLSFGAQQFF